MPHLQFPLPKSSLYQMLLNSPLLLPALPGAAAQLLVARGAEDQTQHSLCESSTAPSTLTQPELASLFFLPAASPPPLHLPTALLIFRAEAASRGALYRAAAGHENQESTLKPLWKAAHGETALFHNTPLPCFLWTGQKHVALLLPLPPAC